MNYLLDLTKEEIKYICSVIPYQETIFYFQKFPKEFTKIRPGFRVKTLNEDMITRTLYEFRNKDFIASYLAKNINLWIQEVDEELEKAKARGLDQDAAYINVISRSFFSGNVKLFFKIKNLEKSEEYFSVLSSAILYEKNSNDKDRNELASVKRKLQELNSKYSETENKLTEAKKKTEYFRKHELEINEKLAETVLSLNEEKNKHNETREKCKQLVARIEELEAEIIKIKDDEVWKSSEMQQKIDDLTQKVKEQTDCEKELSQTIKALEEELASAREDIQTWKNQIRNRQKQIFTYKAERATFFAELDNAKKQISDLKEALELALSSEQAYKEKIEELKSKKDTKTTETDQHDEKKYEEMMKVLGKSVSNTFNGSQYNVPMHPENLDDFDKSFSYGLESIGFNQNEAGAIDFVNYIEKICFHGVPLLIKRGPGINLANLLSNTLYGVPVAERLSYFDGCDVQKIRDYLTEIPDRVVCLDGFIGNCNIIDVNFRKTEI